MIRGKHHVNNNKDFDLINNHNRKKKIFALNIGREERTNIVEKKLNICK